MRVEADGSIKRSVGSFFQTLKRAANGWLDDAAMTHSAALSYYAIFSIAPLILISLAVAGAVFGEEASRNQIFQAFRGLLGADGAKGLQAMVESAARHEGGGVLSAVLGTLTLVIGSTTVFGQLQDSLNWIWKVKAKPGRAAWTLLRQRLLSFSMVLVVAFLLLVSLVLSAALAAVGKYLSEKLPGGAVVWQIIDIGFSLAFTALLFGAIYKILPDVRLRWRDVRVGALVTAFFFGIGKFLIGLYIGRSGVASAYGAGGSAVIFLVWAYYSSAVLFLGAEFTRHHHASRNVTTDEPPLELKPGATWIEIQDSQEAVNAASVAAMAHPRARPEEPQERRA